MKLLDKVLDHYSDDGKEMIWQAVYEWSDLIKDWFHTQKGVIS